MMVEGNITEDLEDEWGLLPTYTTRTLNLDPMASIWTRFIINADNISQPYLFAAVHDGARYYFYATACSWLDAGGMGRYYTKLVLNYTSIAMPNLIRWMPIPSAKDTGLIIRADDVASLNECWLEFWDRYPHSTSAVMADISQETADYVKENCDDYLPHGFSHEDFSVLNYTEQVDLLELIDSTWEGLFGERPYYYIMPYNKANDDTAKAMTATGGLFYITAVSLTGIPTTFYYRSAEDRAMTWGAYYEGGELEDYVDMVIGQGNFVGSVVFHPYHNNWTEFIVPQADYLIDRVLNDSSTLLTTWSEIADLYVVRQSISMDEQYIQFGSDTPAGLTMEYLGMPEGKTLKVGDLVLSRIFDRVVFPAMVAGVYSYELVDIDDYPIVTSVGAGMALKDGSYNLTSGRTTINVEGWDPDGIVTANVTLSAWTDVVITNATGQRIDMSGPSITLIPGVYLLEKDDHKNEKVAGLEFDRSIVALIPLVIIAMIMVTIFWRYHR